ncbi:GDT1-like protein 3 [Glycine soja]
MALSFNNRRIPLALRIFLLFSLFFSLSPTFAQDSLVQNAKEDSGGSVDLGRRAKIALNDIENDSILSLGLDSTGPGLFDAFFASFSMILVSEIGDETFIIAALMAMRHPKSIVLSGALSALIIMTVLSTGLGRIVPNLISRKHTNSAATGYCTLHGDHQIQNPHRRKKWKKLKKNWMVDKGKLQFGASFQDSVHQYFWRQSFILTFLAEWGDRSQIATIALATHKNAIGVAVGATIGHTICTSLAVVGGSMLASKISQRSVATVGGLLFIGFSISSYFYPPL